MRELSKQEITSINGGVIPQVVGAVAGGLGAGYGYIIGSGQSANGMGLIGAVAGGAVMGAINPASGAMAVIRSAATSSFGGAAIGAFGGWMSGGAGMCGR